MQAPQSKKAKLIYLMHILLTETDEAHPIKMEDILSKLEKEGIFVERKTIYDDIKTLQDFGLDIVLDKKKSYGYYVATRDFELPELKLLADAVQSSKFITQNKTQQLIKKLEGLISKHDAGKLRRQFHIQNRIKNMNESIYYNVDSLHEAISEGKKVSFKYFYYNIYKEQVFPRDDGEYIVSPAALSWSEENYYLIGILDGKEGLRHFRVDRMKSVKILEELRDPGVKDFNLTEYIKKMFGMFNGEELTVKLRMHNRLAHTVIDRFGRDIILVPDGDNHFIINIIVAISTVFSAWIFQFGDKCEVLSPQSFKDDLKKQAEAFLSRL